MENPVEVHGNQFVEVGTLQYFTGHPSTNGYYLCRLETSFGGPYYKVLKFDNQQQETLGVSITTHWFDGLRPAYEVTHWAQLPKIQLDSVVPTPER